MLLWFRINMTLLTMSSGREPQTSHETTYITCYCNLWPFNCKWTLSISTFYPVRIARREAASSVIRTASATPLSSRQPCRPHTPRSATECENIQSSRWCCGCPDSLSEREKRAAGLRAPCCKSTHLQHCVFVWAASAAAAARTKTLCQTLRGQSERSRGELSRCSFWILIRRRVFNQSPCCLVNKLLMQYRYYHYCSTRCTCSFLLHCRFSLWTTKTPLVCVCVDSDG